MDLYVVQCSVNFFEPEGYIDSTDYPPLPFQNYLQCAYNITVYMGYGVELQVRTEMSPAIFKCYLICHKNKK